MTTGGPVILMLVCNTPLNRPAIAVTNLVRGNEIFVKDMRSVNRIAKLPAIIFIRFIGTAFSIHIPNGIPTTLARQRGNNSVILSGCLIFRKRNAFNTRPMSVSDVTTLNLSKTSKARGAAMSAEPKPVIP